MNNKICLVIIFNHRYDKNIRILEALYKDKFEKVHYLVPFYNGGQKNVIPVYESSYQFQGYIAQGVEKFYDEKYTHYLFIGDDLILNPLINQENFFEYFGIEENGSYFPKCQPIGRHLNWHYEKRIFNAVQAFDGDSGTNYNEEILKEEGFKKAFEFGYSKKDFVLTWKHFFNGFMSKRSVFRFVISHPKHFIKLFKGVPMSYPVFCGYSDIFLLHREDIKEVSRMAGVFAAMGLFVEMAIPTAMKLKCRNLQEGNAGGKIIWDAEEKAQLEKDYHLELKFLFESWPEDVNYIHPVKLSKWNY